MQRQELYQTQADAPDQGGLQVWVESAVGAVPIENARVRIAYSGDPESTIEQVVTGEAGHAEEVELAAPPLEYSMEPDQPQPYAEYTVTVEADGYQSVDVSGVEVFSGTTAIQNVRLRPLETAEDGLKNIVIPANTLYGDYPPKIAEAEIKPVTESGEIVLSRVVIPEYVVVHDGSPRDSTASDYYVRYKDYIKNVASSEIYATWPDSTIRANVLAIMSFTLNRVYTEWYRGHPSFGIGAHIVLAIVSNSSGRSIGFVRCASIPLSMDFCRSLSKALADRATMGIRLKEVFSSLRIAFVACLPFITGICISIKIRS